jgi:hypothetical protein
MTDVTIVDTSPRDGPVAIPEIRTAEKVALAKRLMQSGLTKIDCVAFTHPRIRPEFADAEEVINALNKKSEVSIIGLAPSWASVLKKPFSKPFLRYYRPAWKKEKPSEFISLPHFAVSMRAGSQSRTLSNL